MTKIGTAYASKRTLARELAHLGARAVTITAVARTKPADSREMHKEVKGVHSQSGQTPTDHRWFLANQTRREHAAFLLMKFLGFRLQHEHNPDSSGLAFVMAYRDYIGMCQGVDNCVVSMERFNLLVSVGYKFGWRNITRGEVSKFASDNVKLMKCRKCLMPALAESHFRTYNCCD